MTQPNRQRELQDILVCQGPCSGQVLHFVHEDNVRACQQEALERSVAAKHEMMKDRMELNRKTRPGPPLQGPISKALEARRTVSAHDRQRAQAFAPLYGDDYEPRLYTGNKPLPPRRDSSAHRTAPKATQDRIHAEQEPTLEHVWEEWEPLKKEEVRLRSELKEYQDYLQSKESVIAEHASLVREVLPPSGLSWAVCIWLCYAMIISGYFLAFVVTTRSLSNR
ncbi:unnamed protein product, partial [Effrenium voratum]